MAPRRPPPGSRPPVSRPREGSERRTLDRLLSRAGLCSRAEATRAVRAGRVTVNGRVVREPSTWVDAERDAVTCDGARVRPAARRWLLVHKPAGVVTTRRDERGRRTIYDLLREALGDRAAEVDAGGQWLAPVGRLDRDTTGLLLLTNDHDLADALTDPVSHLPKDYRVLAEGELSSEQLEALRQGLVLDDGPTRPALVDEVEPVEGRTRLRLRITEGRNRQVRRMLEAVGSRVRRLHREAIGPLSLGDLAEGACRDLTEDEVAALRAAVTRGGRGRGKGQGPRTGAADGKGRDAGRPGRARGGRSPAT